MYLYLAFDKYKKGYNRRLIEYGHLVLGTRSAAKFEQVPSSSRYPLDRYDYKSTCGANKNAMTSSMCSHEEHFRLTPVPDQEEELESSKQSAALGEIKKLSHQLV